MLREIKCLKKCLMLNKIKGLVTSGKDPTQLNFQIVKRNWRKAEAVKQVINNRKLMQMYLKERPKFQVQQAEDHNQSTMWFWLYSHGQKKGLVKFPSTAKESCWIWVMSGVALHAWRSIESVSRSCENKTWVNLEIPRCWRCQSHRISVMKTADQI